MLWILLLVVIGLALVYLFIVRPWLMTHPALAPAFAAEASFVEKMQARITGWKTKIVARLLAVAGIVVGLYNEALPFVTGQDWTPLTARLPSWSIPVGLALIGWMMDKLYKVTQNPPQLVVQKDDTGAPQIVGVMQPPKA
jgi:hypothetical protein